MSLLISNLLDKKEERSLKPKVALGNNVEEKLEKKIQEMELLKKEEEIQKKAQELNLNYVNLKKFTINLETLALIDQEQAEKLKIICFLKTQKEIKIASVNPLTPDILRLTAGLKEKYRREIATYLMSEESFQFTIKQYDYLPKIKETKKGVEITEEDLIKFQEEFNNFENFKEKLKFASLTDIITMLIAFGVKSESSDIHIEAEEEDVKIRFRMDGILYTIASLDKAIWPKIISRIKLISSLKINITDKPQDGRFTIYLTNDQVDVRISCLPTTFGESVVMRLLRSSKVGLSFEDLGLRDRAFDQLKKEVERPNGMILTIGPTGSGKTTTLYAILNKLNKPNVKIITLEDPIEYKLKGINQSQVDSNKNYTFTKGLKAILRQDPDIVMVGEIRDLETAEIAINASLTGHLVISTLHTNSAAATISRFLAMNVKPFLLTPALNAIIGQRLVRKICPFCKEEEKIPEETLKKIKEILRKLPEDYNFQYDLNNLKFYKGKGCVKCNQLKYKGRIGIYEILLMTSKIKESILSKKEEVLDEKIENLAIKEGMITMVQDGLLKALDGITSVEEVFRVTE
ncbi:type II/IV secretion system protein [Candidatus Kuenenbacteria bacterium]|nr:type II/IV secretion system protein [Candidatus Kuenenbacteria bacterium]